MSPSSIVDFPACTSNVATRARVSDTCRQLQIKGAQAGASLKGALGAPPRIPGYQKSKGTLMICPKFEILGGGGVPPPPLNGMLGRKAH